MKTYNVRGRRVVLDRDLASAFGVETKLIKRNVKRHPELFISDEFAFEMTAEECLRCLADTSNHSGRGGSRYLPIAITEKGVQVLKSLMKSYVEVEFEEEIAEVEVMPESWNEGTVVLYQPNEDIRIDVRVENETVWLTQEQMALLLGTTQPNIAMHIRNIFDDGELEMGATYKDFLYVQTEGGKQKNRYIKIYNLDMIISVGYRVNTRNGIAFRQWATKVLKQYLIHKGSFEHRVQLIENNIKAIEQQQQKNTNDISYIKEKVEFIVDTKLPPIEMVFYEGENFKAYDFLCRKREAPLIKMLEIKNDHDRFLIIDETVYHLGPSVKDAGVNRCAVIKMISAPEKILRDLEQCI